MLTNCLEKVLACRMWRPEINTRPHVLSRSLIIHRMFAICTENETVYLYVSYSTDDSVNDSTRMLKSGSKFSYFYLVFFYPLLKTQKKKKLHNSKDYTRQLKPSRKARLLSFLFLRTFATWSAIIQPSVAFVYVRVKPLVFRFTKDAGTGSREVTEVHEVRS